MSDKARDARPSFQFTLPPIQMDAEQYWEKAAQGILLIKRCDDCDRPHFYPREVCPFCAGHNTRWVESSGNGRIYSYTVMRRGLPQPQAIAYVTLNEGPTVLGEIVTEDLNALSIGQPVKAGFVPHFEGRPFLIFRP